MTYTFGNVDIRINDYVIISLITDTYTVGVTLGI